VKSGAQQHDVAVHFDTGLLLGFLHVRHGDVAKVRDVTQVEAHGFSHEQIERHLIDRLAVKINVPERVDVGADVIECGNEVRLERHRVVGHAKIEGLGALVAQVGSDDRPLEKLVCGHIVFNQEAEVDNALCHLLSPFRLAG
jgi:hypothetical protein